MDPIPTRAAVRKWRCLQSEFESFRGAQIEFFQDLLVGFWWDLIRLCSVLARFLSRLHIWVQVLPGFRDQCSRLRDDLESFIPVLWLPIIPS